MAALDALKAAVAVTQADAATAVQLALDVKSAVDALKASAGVPESDVQAQADALAPANAATAQALTDIRAALS